MKHSVILPNFNGEKYILESIDSVLTQLGKGDQLVIVDDASLDNSKAILSNVNDSRITIIFRPDNGGISKTRNDGLRVATGDYIHFIDHDDIWGADRLEHVNEAVGLNDYPDIISGCVEHFYSDDLSAEARAMYRLPSTQKASLAGTVVIRRDIINTAGEFSETLKAGEFIDLMSRAMQANPRWIKVDAIFLKRRIHLSNYTHTNKNFGKDYLTVVRQHLIRKMS